MRITGIDVIELCVPGWQGLTFDGSYDNCVIRVHTDAGLTGIAPGTRHAAMALGLGPLDRLGRVELPLSLPSILAGVTTSAVINVGTATIAAFIGAGGYGERIVSGLALTDTVTLLVS